MFYHYLLIAGIGYIFLAFFTDLEYIMGKYSFALPYAIAGWGVAGWGGLSLFNSFLAGFLPLFVVFTLIYAAISNEGFKVEDHLLEEVKVTVPIPPGKRGEITIDDGSTLRHITAEAYDEIIKPIPKKTMVRIIDVEGNIALVSEEFKISSRKSLSMNFTRKFERFLNSITPKNKTSGTCMVCFAKLVGSRKGFTCPTCQAVAHQTHIKEWLKIKGFCPNCRTELRDVKEVVKSWNGNKAKNRSSVSKT